jgi:two-component system response regulator YesN
VEKVAAMEYLGVSRYRELFRESTGASPVEYIIALRMERAKDLLRHTDMSIDKISEGVGYEDRHYFQKTFKRCVGVTPNEYRRGRGN